MRRGAGDTRFAEWGRAVWPLAAAAALSAVSCGPDRLDAGIVRAERSATRGAEGGTPPDAPFRERPAAMLNGQPITWSDLAPALSEAAGGVVLEERALDLLLERERERAGVEIGAEDLAAERTLLLDSIDEAAALRGDSLSPGQRERLLETTLRARGLGPTRTAALLRRNAILRALVRPEVSVTESAVAQSYALRFGPAIPARLITANTLRDAQGAIDRLDAGEPFGEVAARLSTDPSAARGGLIEPVNPADPSYPSSLRQALETLGPGQRSAPIALDEGFVIVLREPGGSDAPPPPLETVRAEVERDATLRQERLLMDRLARRLLESASVTTFDTSLDASWRARRTGR